MGGLGSGRYYQGSSGNGDKTRAEDCHMLDVNYLARRGHLQPNWQWSVNWSRGGQPDGSISGLTLNGRIVLLYRSRSNGGEWENVELPVKLTETACHYGGRRFWFVCPNQKCGRRVGKLYAAGRYFLCRTCSNLAYASQSEQKPDRMMRKAGKICDRVAGHVVNDFPSEKPKGMHWKTYERLRLQEAELRLMGWQGIMERLTSLLD